MEGNIENVCQWNEDHQKYNYAQSQSHENIAKDENYIYCKKQNYSVFNLNINLN